jgi:hypothetical protein
MVAHFFQGPGQVDGDCALAYSTLAASDDDFMLDSGHSP